VACDELVRRLRGLRDATPALNLAGHPVTRQLLEGSSPVGNTAYKHREDLIDACVAAWTAALWVDAGLERCQVLGRDDPRTDPDGRRATIIAPAKRAQRRYLPVEMPSCFVLEFRRADGSWMDQAVRLIPEDFSETSEGAYLCEDGASGLWLRAKKISRSGVITHVDGAGAEHRYRLIALPSPRYPSLDCDGRR
jgi:hypothetical protein